MPAVDSPPERSVMPLLIPRAVVCLTLALASFPLENTAWAGIGGATPSLFRHLSPMQTVQAGECWNENGLDGPGYYPCGDGGGGPIVGPAIGRPDRHPAGGVSPSPGAAPVSPSLAGVRGANGATGGRVGAPASPGVAGNTAAAPHIAAPASPGPVRSAAAAPHIGAPTSPGPAAGAGGVPHIGAPASPGLAGVHGGGGGGGAIPAGGVGHR